jgi:3-oxoacyl-[acyl-carrier protein] reductase
MSTTPVALISGGSRGIGRACALRLAQDGHDVSVCYRCDSDAADSLVKEVAEFGVRAMAVRVDVGDGAAVRDWVSRTESELGPITVGVTSAGITRDAPLVIMSDEQWNQVLDTNLDGVFTVCRAVVFGMVKRRHGSLVTLSSVSGVHGNAGQANYSAAKAGIIGFTKALAKEVGRYGVRANVVAPGMIDTDMTAQLPEATRDKMLSAIPLRRFGSAAEVAELTAFLASERAAYVTGSVLHVDGGISL